MARKPPSTTDRASNEASVLERFDTDPTRPECTVESETIEVRRGDGTEAVETAATVPYPDPPTSFADADVLEYVDAFERAYVTNDSLCGRRGSGYVLNTAYTVERRETFDWYDDVAIVFLLRAGGATAGADEEGFVWVADLAFSGVVYAVDETGVARAAFDEASALDEDEDEFEARAPDPLEDGELVARFESDCSRSDENWFVDCRWKPRARSERSGLTQ